VAGGVASALWIILRGPLLSQRAPQDEGSGFLKQTLSEAALSLPASASDSSAGEQFWRRASDLKVLGVFFCPASGDPAARPQLDARRSSGPGCAFVI
jgi:hypothetical protein